MADTFSFRPALRPNWQFVFLSTFPLRRLSAAMAPVAAPVAAAATPAAGAGLRGSRGILKPILSQVPPIRPPAPDTVALLQSRLYKSSGMRFRTFLCIGTRHRGFRRPWQTEGAAQAAVAPPAAAAAADARCRGSRDGPKCLIPSPIHVPPHIAALSSPGPVEPAVSAAAAVVGRRGSRGC
jgi:hypothetical protein